MDSRRSQSTRATFGLVGRGVAARKPCAATHAPGPQISSIDGSWLSGRLHTNGDMLDSVRDSAVELQLVMDSPARIVLDPPWIYRLKVGVYVAESVAFRFGGNACVGSCASAGPAPLRLPRPGQTPGAV